MRRLVGLALVVAAALAPPLGAQTPSGAAPDDVELLKCANLIYAGSKSSVCFSHKFLATVEKETNVLPEKKFTPCKLASDDIFNLLTYDPTVIGLIALTCWLVYPIARLAWFFCYLDARVRAEGWDVEIAFRLEAKRLSHAG